MSNESSTIVQRLWNYCNVLRDDGVSYGDYVEQLTYLLFLKINDETLMGLDIDIKGEIYEGLLQKNAEDIKSGAGQYFTPRPLIKAMVEAIKPEPGMTICDPACGTGGFLLAAHDYISKHSARDIAENLESALGQFSSIQEDLEQCSE